MRWWNSLKCAWWSRCVALVKWENNALFCFPWWHGADKLQAGKCSMETDDHESGNNSPITSTLWPMGFQADTTGQACDAPHQLDSPHVRDVSVGPQEDRRTGGQGAGEHFLGLAAFTVAWRRFAGSLGYLIINDSVRTRALLKLLYWL